MAVVEDEIKERWAREQNELKKQLLLEDAFTWMLPNGMALGSGPVQQDFKYVGGVDISFIKGNNIDACASLVVLEYPSMKVVYEKCEMIKLTLPYVSGFLAFREVGFIV